MVNYLTIPPKLYDVEEGEIFTHTNHQTPQGIVSN